MRTIRRWKITAMTALLTSFGLSSALAQERGPRREPMDAEAWLEHLDQDRDGGVSMQEFDGPREHFQHLDRNQDGVISGEEVPDGPTQKQEGHADEGRKRRSDDQQGREQGQPRPGPRPEGFIQRLDQDGDQQVSLTEFDGPEEHFVRMDRNQDGQISQDEAPKGPPPRKDQHSRRDSGA